MLLASVVFGFIIFMKHRQFNVIGPKEDINQLHISYNNIYFFKKVHAPNICQLLNFIQPPWIIDFSKVLANIIFCILYIVSNTLFAKLVYQK